MANPPRRAPKRPRRRGGAAAADLLFELGTEELPPRPLRRLSRALGELLHAGLDGAGLANPESARYRVYATPRRLAVCVPQVRLHQPDRVSERRGPALAAAFDAAGKPSAAAIGFARACGVSPQQLERVETDKGGWLVFRRREPGAPARRLLPGIVADALAKLPVPKRMRWGALEAEFIRPVHWVVLLHGAAVVPCELLSMRAGRLTYGHRFHHPRALALRSPQDYPQVLRQRAHVIAEFEAREALIRSKVLALARRKGGQAVIDEALLEEVAALVEWPVPLLGSFDERFLVLPPEPLVTTLRDHQRCFPVTNGRGRLLPYFIAVANIQSRRPAAVRAGNERVIRARFADAQFFWESDRRQPLADRVPGLRAVVFHDRLGSLYDKVGRVRVLAVELAATTGADTARAERAALLAKADLLSGMVGEFPQLQGIMGRHYALHDGEDPEVASAIEEHYLPRQAGDRLPATPTGQALAIADRLDSLVGLFAAGEAPTGDKDPYGLRRAALAVLRITIEQRLDLDLRQLLERAAQGHPPALRRERLVADVYDFMMERLRAYYLDTGVSADVYEAVLARRPERPHDFDQRVRAVMAFRRLPEAESLTSANKRIRNILKQAGELDSHPVSVELLQEDAERRLAQRLAELRARLEPVFAAGRYTEAMQALALLRPQVDEFFDKVLVMAPDQALRENRLALLASLDALFLRVADLSRLQG